MNQVAPKFGGFSAYVNEIINGRSGKWYVEYFRNPVDCIKGIEQAKKIHGSMVAQNPFPAAAGGIYRLDIAL